MKTSSALILLLLVCSTGGGVQGFTRSAKQQRLGVARGARSVLVDSYSWHSRPSTSTKTVSESRLFQQALDNPKQELLNNRHSASDWLYNVRSLPQSQVLREIRNPVLSVFAWACFVSLVQRFMTHSKLSMVRSLALKMCIPGTAHSFLMSSLGLLLVFRTNSAYQRFNEGRKIWEHVLSVSRNMTRLIQLYSREVGADRMQRMFKLIAAYPYLLRHHIRPGCLCVENHLNIDPEYRLMLREPSLLAVETRHDGDKQCPGGSVQSQEVWTQRRECWVDRRNLPWSLFPESALRKVAKARNRPLWVCDRIGQEIMQIPYSDNFTSRERLTMIGHIDKLTNAVGECERIQQTAVPLNYARHSLRSLTLWLFTLPFALVKDLGLLTGPVTACAAWLLFGVYQIGYSIEDPFQGSLRLSLLCDAIRRDVLDASSEGLPDDGSRDSAYALEASQAIEELERPEDLISALSNGTDFESIMSKDQYKAVESTQQSVDFSGDTVIIDPNLINPPQFIEKNGKLFVTSLASKKGITQDLDV